MARCQHLTDLIDDRIRKAQGTPKNPDKGLRRHLGASVIGRDCMRELWYSHRWAVRARHDGRVLRLFDRGHEEEPRFADWLEIVGAEVQRFDPNSIWSVWYHASNCYVVYPPGDVPPQEMLSQGLDVTDDDWHIARARKRGHEIPDPSQFGFKGVYGHFAGSMDGKARFVPFQVEYLSCNFNEWILTEFKTHGEKSFNKLIADNDLEKSKPDHYAQMIIYIDEHQLPGGIYGAVNKNTDELYWEFVKPNPAFAEQIRQKASLVVFSPKPPPRISNSPSWYICKFCTNRPVCHFGAPLAKSCRTCAMSAPAADGRWHCNKYNRLIPKEFESEGCDFWSQIYD